LIVGLAVAISVWACLPFSRTFISSPPIVGVYRAETGEPLSGVQLAISLTSLDSLCASPARQTMTDSAGAFALPLTEDRDAIIIFLPIEHVFSYTFCARVAGNMRFAHQGSALMSFDPTPVSLTCIESRTPNTAPVVCTEER
jgi:hypothetical protein